MAKKKLNNLMLAMMAGGENKMVKGKAPVKSKPVVKGKSTKKGC